MSNTVRLKITADDDGVIKVYGNIAAASKKTAKQIADDNAKAGESHGKLKSAVGATGEALKKMGELAVGASAAVGAGIYESVKAAGQLQAQSVQLQNALQRTGQYSKATFNGMVTGAQMAATKGGYAVQQQIQAMSQFVRVTQSHTKAQQLNTLAMNVARGSGQDYLKVVQAISMAQEGKVTQLTRLGLGVNAKASPAQAMAELQAKFGGAMNAYSNTAPGAMSNMTQAFDMMKEDLGKAFLPLVSTLAGSLSKSLPALESALQRITGPLSKTLNELLPPLVAVISKLLPPLLSAMSSIIAPLAKAITSLMPPVTQAIQMILPPVISAFDRIVSVLAPALGRIVQALAPVLARVIGVLAPVMAKVIDTLVPPLTKIFVALAPVMLQMINLLAPVIIRLINQLAPPMVKLITSLQPVILQLTKAFIQLATPLTKALVALMPVAIKFIDAIASMVKAVGKITGGVIGDVGHVAQGIGHFLSHPFGLHNGGLVRHFADGGLVSGPGSGDVVPAMIEPGEYVLTKRAVQEAGVSNLNALNSNVEAPRSASVPVSITIPVQIGQRVIAESTVQYLLKQHARSGAWSAA